MDKHVFFDKLLELEDLLNEIGQEIKEFKDDDVRWKSYIKSLDNAKKALGGR